ncbi:hypothetical protein GEMRC1_000730 [Eukaryota sp. GEM-RC1]
MNSVLPLNSSSVVFYFEDNLYHVDLNAQLQYTTSLVGQIPAPFSQVLVSKYSHDCYLILVLNSDCIRFNYIISNPTVSFKFPSFEAIPYYSISAAFLKSFSPPICAFQTLDDSLLLVQFTTPPSNLLERPLTSLDLFSDSLLLHSCNDSLYFRRSDGTVDALSVCPKSLNVTSINFSKKISPRDGFLSVDFKLSTFFLLVCGGIVEIHSESVEVIRFHLPESLLSGSFIAVDVVVFGNNLIFLVIFNTGLFTITISTNGNSSNLELVDSSKNISGGKLICIGGGCFVLFQQGSGVSMLKVVEKAESLTEKMFKISNGVLPDLLVDSKNISNFDGLNMWLDKVFRHVIEPVEQNFNIAENLCIKNQERLSNQLALTNELYSKLSVLNSNFFTLERKFKSVSEKAEDLVDHAHDLKNLTQIEMSASDIKIFGKNEIQWENNLEKFEKKIDGYKCKVVELEKTQSLKAKLIETNLKEQHSQIQQIFDLYKEVHSKIPRKSEF